MSKTFFLDGVEYATDALHPQAAVIIDALEEIDRRSAPIQRDLMIMGTARDSLIHQLRIVMQNTQNEQAPEEGA
jgi:hypothetical protein